MVSSIEKRWNLGRGEITQLGSGELRPGWSDASRKACALRHARPWRGSAHRHPPLWVSLAVEPLPVCRAPLAQPYSRGDVCGLLEASRGLTVTTPVMLRCVLPCQRAGFTLVVQKQGGHQTGRHCCDYVHHTHVSFKTRL